MTQFAAKRTCSECPWRTDVAVGRFKPERYRALEPTCRQQFDAPLARSMAAQFIKLADEIEAKRT